MHTSEAKRIIKAELVNRGLPFSKVSAKTVSFSDLARGESVFVSVKDWDYRRLESAEQSRTIWAELKALAHANGFCLE